MIEHKLSKCILATFALFVLGGCESNEQKQAKQQRQASKANAPELPTGNYFQNDSQHKVMSFQRHRALKNVAQQMNQNYKQLGTVAYDSKNTIVLNMTTKQSKQLFQYLPQHDKSAEKFWKQLTSGLDKTSKEISKQTKDSQLKFIVNNDKGEQVFSVQNGQLLDNKYK